MSSKRVSVYLSFKTAAEETGVTRDAIRKAVLRGELAEVDIDGRKFVQSEQLTKWMLRPRFKASGRRPKKAAP